MTAEYYLTGLDNLGNTCYINSSLQALYAIKEFRQYIVRHKSSGPLHCSLSELFKLMITSKDKYIRPEEFKSRFIKFKPQFQSGQQHDAQEFLRLLIDGIHEEVNYAKNRKRIVRQEPKSAIESWNQYLEYMDNSYLVKLFVGQLTSTIKCINCNKESVCWDTFWDISLSLPESEKECDINDCIKKYTEEEVLDNDSMPTCTQCKQKTKSIKALHFNKFPLILIFQLKKFGNNGQKISKAMIINDSIVINCKIFELFACICHKGSCCSSGHYYSYCKFESEKWYFFDDETVTTVENLTNDLLNGAYILFYRNNTDHKQ